MAPLPRRTLLLGSAALACMGMASGLPVPPGDRLSYRILRNGSVIGTHVVDFSPAADRLTVTIAVDIAVGIGPLVLFRYTHRSTENWAGGRLQAMETVTNDDGTHDFVHLHRVTDGLEIESSRFGRFVAPADAMPGSHWNETMLRHPIINTQHGKVLYLRVAKLGEEPVPDAAGGTIDARHFALRGDVNVDLWYDRTPSWVALTYVAHEGSHIRYERL
jgi:hypothetical protein